MKSKIYRIQESNSSPEIVGNGNKGLLIIIAATDKEENLTTLEGLVKAIKFNIEEDVSIVSCREKFTPINTFLSTKKYSTIILIGVSPDQVGFSVTAKKYFIYKMESFDFLWVDSLGDLNADKSKKMAFWKNLQSQFLS